MKALLHSGGSAPFQVVSLKRKQPKLLLELVLQGLSIPCRWERLRPLLPRAFEGLWAGVFRLKEPTGAMTPIGSYLLRPSFGGLERILDAVWIAPPIAKVLFQIFIRPFKARDCFSSCQGCISQRECLLGQPITSLV